MSVYQPAFNDHVLANTGDKKVRAHGRIQLILPDGSCVVRFPNGQNVTCSLQTLFPLVSGTVKDHIRMCVAAGMHKTKIPTLRRSSGCKYQTLSTWQFYSLEDVEAALKEADSQETKTLENSSVSTSTSTTSTATSSSSSLANSPAFSASKRPLDVLGAAYADMDDVLALASSNMEQCLGCSAFYSQANPPRYLPCAHRICTVCVNTGIEGGKVDCPKSNCYQSSTHTAAVPLQKSSFIVDIGLLRHLEMHKQSSSSSSSSSSSTSSSSTPNIPAERMCWEHTQPFTQYDITAKRMVCDECKLLPSNASHTYCSPKEALPHLRAEASQVLLDARPLLNTMQATSSRTHSAAACLTCAQEALHNATVDVCSKARRALEASRDAFNVSAKSLGYCDNSKVTAAAGGRTLSGPTEAVTTGPFKPGAFTPSTIGSTFSSRLRSVIHPSAGPSARGNAARTGANSAQPAPAPAPAFGWKGPTNPRVFAGSNTGATSTGTRTTTVRAGSKHVFPLRPGLDSVIATAAATAAADAAEAAAEAAVKAAAEAEAEPKTSGANPVKSTNSSEGDKSKGSPSPSSSSSSSSSISSTTSTAAADTQEAKQEFSSASHQNDRIDRLKHVSAHIKTLAEALSQLIPPEAISKSGKLNFLPSDVVGALSAAGALLATAKSIESVPELLDTAEGNFSAAQLGPESLDKAIKVFTTLQTNIETAEKAAHILLSSTCVEQASQAILTAQTLSMASSEDDSDDEEDGKSSWKADESKTNQFGFASNKKASKKRANEPTPFDDLLQEGRIRNEALRAWLEGKFACLKHGDLQHLLTGGNAERSLAPLSTFSTENAIVVTPHFNFKKKS